MAVLNSGLASKYVDSHVIFAAFLYTLLAGQFLKAMSTRKSTGRVCSAPKARTVTSVPIMVFFLTKIASKILYNDDAI